MRDEPQTSRIATTALEQELLLDDVMADASANAHAPARGEDDRNALQTTLGIASSAASLVLYPYVAAGKVAYSATSYAVHAPIKITRHVKDSLLGGAASDQSNRDAAAYDLFGERSSSSSSDSESDSSSSGRDTDSPVDLFGEHEFTTVIEATDVDAADTSATSADDAPATAGVVSQLLFLPVRLVSTSVSTAAAIPGSLISYSGRKISGAASTSKALATTALVVSSGAVARTSLNVAQGLTVGALSTASFTASTLSGAVGTSVRTAKYVVPASVSNAVWQSVGATGSASVSVVSYAIAVPAYRMLAALVPDVAQFVSERDCIERTRDVVYVLVQTLGPQNALYVLKYVYETVNSDEAYDLFLLCHDVVRESLDRDNYKRIGASVGDATGVNTLAPVVRELVSMLPSADELFDAFAFVADVSEEVVSSLLAVPEPKRYHRSERDEDQEGRFTYVIEDDESTFERDGDDETTASYSSSEDDDAPAMSDESERRSDSVGISTLTFELSSDCDDDEPIDDANGDDWDVSAFSFGARTPSTHEPAAVVDAGVALLAQVCDSDAASLLFNTFGDFLDVLMD